MEIQSITFVSLITAFILLLLMFLIRKPNSSKTAKLPPSPWKLPIIGSIHHLAGYRLLHHALRDLSRKYGPLMHIQLGEVPAVVISSPEMAEQVMKVHDLAFANRPQILATKIAFYDGEDILFSPYGSYWRQMRKICILELLSEKNVHNFSTIREDEAKQLIESIKLSVGLPINMTERIYSLTSAVTARAAFGKRCQDQDAVIEVVKEVALLMAGFHVSDLFPSLALLQNVSGTKAKLLRVHRKMDNILQRIVSEHEENLVSSGRGNGESGEEDLVDVLLRHQRSGDLVCPITTKNIKAAILDMISAGTDTSSTTAAWAMSELMKNPKAMEKAQTEIRKAWMGKSTIHEADMQGLIYLKSVIKETLRLHPPPLLVPRECRVECEIEGYTIPVKTKVIVNAWAIGRDPRFWTDPESFLPERFDKNSSNITFGGTDYQFIPFGAGRRMCPGMSFGHSNVEVVLAYLLYNFDWKLPDGMKLEDLDMTETFGATAIRRNDLYVVATPYVPQN